MFEGKPPQAGAARPVGQESWEGDALRELTWADLVARLAATRGGGSVVARTDESEASFDASSARRIAAHHNGKQTVNLEDSSYRKGLRGTAFPPVTGTGGRALPGAARK